MLQLRIVNIFTTYLISLSFQYQFSACTFSEEFSYGHIIH